MYFFQTKRKKKKQFIVTEKKKEIDVAVIYDREKLCLHEMTTSCSCQSSTDSFGYIQAVASKQLVFLLLLLLLYLVKSSIKFYQLSFFKYVRYNIQP